MANMNGWIDRNWLIDTFGSWAKRHDGADWFALIASIGKDEKAFTEIGAGSTCVAETAGEIELFANDAWGFYWNNHGAAKIRIEMLDGGDSPRVVRAE
jgi:hypothetical protein